MNIILIVLAALCCGSVAFTITVTGMFKWFRDFWAPKHPKIDELVHCPWCFGHWVTFIFLFYSDLQYLPFSNHVGFNFLATAFTMMAIQGLLQYVLLRAFEPVQKMMAQRKIDALKAKKVN